VCIEDRAKNAHIFDGKVAVNQPGRELATDHLTWAGYSIEDGVRAMGGGGDGCCGGCSGRFEGGYWNSRGGVRCPG